MNITPDYLVERRRIKTQVTKWKIISMILLLVFVGSVGHKMVNNDPFPLASKTHHKGGYIASLTFEEIIMDNLPRIKKIEQLAEDDNIKAVIVHINSPGGSTVGAEMLYNAFRKLSKHKPIVAVMDSVAASGGYLISLGADYIIAHNGTVTGSIGTLMQTAEVTELAEKIGVKFNNFKSGELKANPSFTEKLNPEAEKAVMDSVFDVYDYFTAVVAERRNLDIDLVRHIADGRIYSSKRALQYKLIDAIGNEDTAVKWLEDVKGITKDLHVSEVKLNHREKFIDILFDDLENSISAFVSKNFVGFKSLMF